jgi:CubicO group peptidase (beta-lactamase class C family)
VTGAVSRRLALGLLGSVPVAAAVTAGGSAQASPPPSLLPGGTFDQRLAQLAAQDQLSVTVLLSYRGQPVLARAFGISLGTIVALGSVTKLFTATAIMQLVAQGKVGLYQTLGSYLDGFPAQIAGAVTVHQLLTHTSGMDDYLSSTAYQQQRLTWTSAAEVMDGTMAIIKQSPLLFTPGTQFSYSNSGYATLGAIVARVSGQSYYDYVREHILAAAGMSQSDFYTRPQWLTDPRIAHPYGTAGGKGQPGGPVIDLTSQEDFIGGPAGNAFATAPDMIRFARALTSGRLVGPAWTGVMTSVKVPLTPQQAHQWPPSQLAAFGYGPEIRIVNDQTVFGHTGGAAGETAAINIYPDRDLVTVFLSNYTITNQVASLIQLLDQLITQHAT